MEGDGRPRITRLIDAAEKVVYYIAALFLLANVVLVFVAAGWEMLSVLEKGLLPTALSVLDSVLLIFIFA
jgi:hypothetical protein